MTTPKSQNVSASSSEAKGLSLLFADDERSLQELMKLEIPRKGHRVTVCPDGLTAVAALEKESFDCLLLDLDMPGLGGIEVIARAKELCPDAETVVLTGKSSLETAIAALRYGRSITLPSPASWSRSRPCCDVCSKSAGSLSNTAPCSAASNASKGSRG